MCIRDRLGVVLVQLFALQGHQQRREDGHEDEEDDDHQGSDRHLVALEPVSYTHLDVYKRQVGTSGRGRVAVVAVLGLLGLLDRRGLSERSEVGQGLPALLKVEDDLVALGLDAGEGVTELVLTVCVVPGTPVLCAILEEVDLVGRTRVGEGERALDRVGDVVGGDGRAVGVLDAVLDREGPGETCLLYTSRCV